MPAALPKYIKRGEIYNANFGEGPDLLVVIVSSNESNALMRDIGVCEVLRQAPIEYEKIPIAAVLGNTETSLAEKLVVMGKVANVPKGVLIEKEGNVSALAMERLDQAIRRWLGFDPWP
ncbi:MAG: type II toxin-antitoxin system PemK/MazF family toxin [Elusimicrobia bacterium]|nr:type II toxin-antitoxin system PemK/MazF family toxin [Elusimicrobiota bacterium]